MQKNSHLKLRALCEGAVFVALAQILGYIKLFELPNGGAVNFGMLPIFLFCARWGFGKGMLASFCYSLLQLMLDGAYAWGWQSMIGDYIVAFTVLGVAGLFYKHKHGLYIGTVGVGLILHSYVTPGAYETFVKELAPRYGIELGKFKTAYDCSSLLLGVIFSFVFFGFGNFVGIRLGTVLCAAVNGTLVAMNSRLVEKLFYFEDAVPKLGKFFRGL